MSDRYILDELDNVIEEPDLMKWGTWFQTDDRRRVALTEVKGMRVSTVFLGLDHRFGDDGPPLVFETMVFPGNGWTEAYCLRYSSKEEALTGHAKAVQMVESGEITA